VNGSTNVIDKLFKYFSFSMAAGFAD